MQFRFYDWCNEGLAVFRTENQVNENEGEGLRHGGTLNFRFDFGPSALDGRILTLT